MPTCTLEITRDPQNLQLCKTLIVHDTTGPTETEYAYKIFIVSDTQGGEPLAMIQTNMTVQQAEFPMSIFAHSLGLNETNLRAFGRIFYKFKNGVGGDAGENGTIGTCIIGQSL